MAIASGIEDYVAIRIPVQEGRAYSVLHMPSLSNAAWERTAFSTDVNAEPSATYLTTSKTETGTRTIFVKKDGPQYFYKVNLE